MAEADDPPAPAPASASLASAGGEPKLKMPIQVSIPTTEEKSGMLKSYTAYCIVVNDFGQQVTVERRFDDFNQLYVDVSAYDKNLPPMPEKKMWASCQEDVVAERKAAFEKLLRYMLRTEAIVFDEGKHIWKFLDLSTPAMVAARYMFKSRRLQYLKQCWKLLDEKYIKEHAYRLSHESILKINLHLLSRDGNFVGGKAAAAAAASAAAAAAAAAADPVPDGDGEKVVPPKAADPSELETYTLEMVRHALGQGGDDSRKTFLEGDGLAIVWRLQLRIAQRPGVCSAPDDRVRKVLSALIHVSGDRYAEVLADFLKNGGVTILAGFQDLCKQHGAFAEFIGKALWLAWAVETQQAFLEGDESAGADALGLLGAIFSCGTKVSQILAGLLLSSLIANDFFASNRAREDQAAKGISGVLEELLVSMPTFLDPRKSKEAGVSEEVQAAEQFITASLSRNEKAFARILTCVSAPCNRNPHGVEHVESAAWSACSMALWCLIKMQPKSARVAKLRPSIPLLAQYGPPRVRWLTGELLLQLHCEESASTASEKESERIGAEASGHEQNAVEAAMSENLNSSLAQLQDDLSNNRSLMSQQQQLSDARQQSLAIRPDGSCFADLSKALERLMSVREKLAKISTTTESAEVQGTASIDNLSQSLMEGEGDTGVGELHRALSSVQDIESIYLGKKAELTQLEEALQEQSSSTEQCRIEMEEADSAVSAVRKRIAEMEQELSSKQREAQQQRTLASSDMGSRRSKLTADSEEIDIKLLKLREKAQKMQAREPLEPGGPPPDDAKVQEVMGQLKQEAAKLKQRKAEIQVELGKASGDPAACQENAQRLESESNSLHDQLNFVRSSELQELERSHVGGREGWQQQMSRLQEIRSLRDSLERECGDLKSQLDVRWRVWQPMWSARLTCWHGRASALSEAQVSHHRFSEKVNSAWEMFREEEAVRGEVLQAAATVQESLSALSQQLTDVGFLQ